MKKARQFAKLAASFASRPGASADFVGVPGVDQGTYYSSLKDACDWLLQAQVQDGDDGFSRKFDLRGGWDVSYIETTGYILTTLLNASDFLQSEIYAERALAAARWLVSQQGHDGFFTDVDDFLPHVFDTGQVLGGLLDAAEAADDTEDSQSFMRAAVGAGRWLVKWQDPTGAWVQHAYRAQPHSYYSRVASALVRLGIQTGDQVFIDAGLRQVHWALSQRHESGLYHYSSFSPDAPILLHTAMYVLEGFWDTALYLNNEDLQLETQRSLHSISSLPRSRYGWPNAYYDVGGTKHGDEVCVTGLAQYAGLCLKVGDALADVRCSSEGLAALDFLRHRQFALDTVLELRGGLPSSIPVWGSYGGMAIYNWNVKFYADALIEAIRIGGPSGVGYE